MSNFNNFEARFFILKRDNISNLSKKDNIFKKQK